MNFSKIDIIAQNFEKYMTFSFSVFRFLDSFSFLASSLDTLSSNLLKDGEHNFQHTLKGDYTNKQKQLILKKGVYPYEYIDCYDRFNEEKLPNKDAFYSSLSEVGIKDNEYKHAQEVWKEFNIKTIGEYHDLYLKTDVLLLTDVFESFRNTAINDYKLDPANDYITLPSYAWDAMLYKTNIKLEQLTDPDMYLFCERGIRGGTSMISHRYAKANNKYIKNYDENIKSSYIMYLDANNLYGGAMCEKMPYGKFKWINNFDERFIKNYNANGDKGCFVECDLEYPAELHNLHNDYPLAPETRPILTNELSNYQLNQLQTHNEKHNEKINKLVPNLYDKKHYVVHIRNLQYY